MKLLAVLILLNSISCSSAVWKPCGVSPEKQVWEWCNKSKHSDQYDRKGFCYVATECLDRLWPLPDLKRNKILFCAFGDMKCFDENDLFHKSIVPR